MRKKFAFVTAVALALTVALALFAGCSSGSEEDKTPETEEVAVTSVVFDRETLELTVGQTGTLVVTVSPQNATNKTIVWTSGDPSVVTVRPDGTVTAVGVGQTTVTAASLKGDKTATCTVTVSAAQE